MSAEYGFDLYPRDDPRDGVLLVRYTFEDLIAAEYRDVIGVGSGQATLWANHAGAEFVDVRGEQYVRVVRLGGVEAVVGGIWTSKLPFETATASEQRHLTISGPGQMAYLARARMAPHTYIHDLFIGQDPFDGMWRLFAQGLGNTLGAILYRVIYEAQHFRNTPTYTHEHGDGLLYTDSHADDRLASKIPDLVMGFDNTDDSNGNPWTLTSGDFTAQVGENVLGVVQRLMQSGLSLWMDPDDFTLYAWEGRPATKLGRSTDRTGAAWGADVVRFQYPTDGTTATGNILSETTRVVNAYLPQGPIWVGGNDIYHKETGPADALYEGFVPSAVDDLTALANIGAAQSTAREEAADVGQVKHRLGDDETNGAYLPGEHYLLDELVRVDTGTGEFDYDEDDYPVGAWRVSLPEGGAEWEAFADLGASYEEAQRREFAVPSTPGHTHPPSPAICRDTDGSLVDPFERTVADGWGQSPIHNLFWRRGSTPAAETATVSVNGTHGLIVTGNANLWIVPGEGAWTMPLEFLIEQDWDVASGTTEGDFEFELVQVNSSAPSTNRGVLQFHWERDGSGNLLVDILINGDNGDLASAQVQVLTNAQLLSGPFKTRIVVDHDGTDLTGTGRVWLSSGAEPGTWDVDETLTDTILDSFDLKTESLMVDVNSGAGTISFESIEVVSGLAMSADTCIHGGPLANDGEAGACNKCVAAGNHEHDYVAAGGTAEQLLKKGSSGDWDTYWADAPAAGAPTTANYLVGTANASLSAEIVVGTTPGGELGGTWGSPTVDATHSGSTHASRAPSTSNYLVGTADAGLSAEIVVGTTPGGELGGTWASPTIDATHSGSSHAGVVTAHEGAADPHTGYVQEADANWVDLTDGGATALHSHAGAAHTHVFSETPAGTIDGVNDAFTLAATPAAGTLALYKNGLRQRAGAGNDYTLAVATITYEAGNLPETGDSHVADYVS